ncbi:hypothetical protein PYCC9005_003250 [Savitreella phatthalungensis]
MPRRPPRATLRWSSSGGRLGRWWPRRSKALVTAADTAELAARAATHAPSRSKILPRRLSIDSASRLPRVPVARPALIRRVLTDTLTPLSVSSSPTRETPSTPREKFGKASQAMPSLLSRTGASDQSRDSMWQHQLLASTPLFDIVQSGSWPASLALLPEEREPMLAVLYPGGLAKYAAGLLKSPEIISIRVTPSPCDSRLSYVDTHNHCSFPSCLNSFEASPGRCPSLILPSPPTKQIIQHDHATGDQFRTAPSDHGSQPRPGIHEDELLWRQVAARRGEVIKPQMRHLSAHVEDPFEDDNHCAAAEDLSADEEVALRNSQLQVATLAVRSHLSSASASIRSDTLSIHSLPHLRTPKLSPLPAADTPLAVGVDRLIVAAAGLAATRRTPPMPPAPCNPPEIQARRPSREIVQLATSAPPVSPTTTSLYSPVESQATAGVTTLSAPAVTGDNADAEAYLRDLLVVDAGLEAFSRRQHQHSPRRQSQTNNHIGTAIDEWWQVVPPRTTPGDHFL